MAKTIFTDYLSGSSTSVKRNKIKELKNLSYEELKGWIYSNMRTEEIITMLADYIDDELNDYVDKIKITQEQFDTFFKVIKRHKKNEAEEGIDGDLPFGD